MTPYWNYEIEENRLIYLISSSHMLLDCSNEAPSSILGYIKRNYRVFQNGSCVGYVSDEVIMRLFAEGKLIPASDGERWIRTTAKLDNGEIVYP